MHQNSLRSATPSQPSESAGIADSKIHTVTLSAIRAPAKLSEIPNSENVEVTLGKLKQSECYGQVFSALVWRSSGKVPGSDAKMPEVRFYLSADFERLARSADRSITGTGMGLKEQADSTLAWLDYEDGRAIIEVSLPSSINQLSEGPISMRASDFKYLLSNLIHEATHSAKGDSEFSAFMAGDTFLHRCGIHPNAPDPVELMKRIQRIYPEDAHLVALNDFEQSYPERAQEYYEWLETQETP